MSGTVTCRGCGGWQYRGDDDGRPWGWYQLSVNVPAFMTRNRQPYLWAGMWCSAACLAGSADDLIRQEELAHQVYEPDLPSYDPDPCRQAAEQEAS